MVLPSPLWNPKLSVTEGKQSTICGEDKQNLYQGGIDYQTDYFDLEEKRKSLFKVSAREFVAAGKCYDSSDSSENYRSIYYVVIA